jgi:hypothetical protein
LEEADNAIKGKAQEKAAAEDALIAALVAEPVPAK